MGDAPTCEPALPWWRGHSPGAVLAIVFIVCVSTAPFFAGYFLAPPGLHFTGAPTYAEDVAQHEAWALDIATHLRYRNLLTPEPTGRGWFFSAFELVLGLTQRATGVPYMALANGLNVVCAPLLAFALMTVARRAGIPSAGTAAVVAMLAGSLAPLVHAASALGLLRVDIATTRSVGGDATPIFAGPNLYLVLAVLVLATLPTIETAEPAAAFRTAGLALFALAAIYPFFVPTLWLAIALYSPFWLRAWGWRATARGIAWLAISALPMLYWAVLPMIDGEYARFAARNRRPLFSVRLVLVSLGLGSGAILGLPWLLRGTPYRRLLAAFVIAALVALYVPAHPWRSHIFYLSPVFVLAAIAAWRPLLWRLPPVARWTVTAVLLAAAMVSIPYYHARNVRGLMHFAPPTYLTSGDVAAIDWLAKQPGTDVVLARPDVSPWVGARAGHRVLVGHYLSTRDYTRRRAAVEAVFDHDADPRPLLRGERVGWVLIDEERGAPAWARGVPPAARFDRTVVLSAERVIAELDRISARPDRRGDAGR